MTSTLSLCEKAKAQWAKDQAAMARGRGGEPIRLFAGLAAIVVGVWNALHLKNHVLIGNGDLLWMGVRPSVGPGHFHSEPRMNQRDVTYISLARGFLDPVGGMPRIDFEAQPAVGWDFNFKPGAGSPYAFNLRENAREFEVAAMMSEAITLAAFCAVDRSGKPYQPSWAAKRRLAGIDVKPFRLESMNDVMPTPYVAFPTERWLDVWPAATQPVQATSRLDCRRCGRAVDLNYLRQAQPLDGVVSTVTAVETGEVIADCPFCKERQLWDPSHAQAGHTQRRFGTAFMFDLCRALANGMPLAIAQDAAYIGPVSTAKGYPTSDGEVLQVSGHKFRGLGDQEFVLFLPKGAEVLAQPGQELTAGEIWSNAFPVKGEQAHRIKRWQHWTLADKWDALPHLVGGEMYLDYVQELYFQSRALVLADKQEILYPAAYVIMAAKVIPPVPGGLYWDFEGADQYLVPELKAYVLPPIPLRNWDSFRFSFGHGLVDVNTKIGDPRFCWERKLNRELTTTSTSPAASPVVSPVVSPVANSAPKTFQPRLVGTERGGVRRAAQPVA